MKLQKVVPLATFVFIIACGTVMLPIDSLIHRGDVGHTANIVNQYLVWETVEVDASLINVDPTLAAQTPDAVGPLLETPRAMIEFMATVAGVTPFPQGTPISEETPAACREDPPGPSCPPPPPATPTPVITVTAVISNSDCASVCVIMENTTNLEGEFCFTWYVYGDEDGKRLSIRAISKRLTEMNVPTWAAWMMPMQRDSVP